MQAQKAGKYGLKKNKINKPKHPFRTPKTLYIQRSWESQQTESQHITGESKDTVTQKECGNLKIDLAPAE